MNSEIEERFKDLEHEVQRARVEDLVSITKCFETIQKQLENLHETDNIVKEQIIVIEKCIKNLCGLAERHYKDILPASDSGEKQVTGQEKQEQEQEQPDRIQI